MRLVDYLILVLRAHAQALQRLAALFGEEVLVEMLEISGEQADEKSGQAVGFSPSADWFRSGREMGGSPYAELEGAVRELSLSPMLEFHLWAYPFYRSLIESSIELDSKLELPPRGTATPTIPIVEATISEAERWIHRLPIPPAQSRAAEQAVRVAWVRFRTEALKTMGFRPVGAIG